MSRGGWAALPPGATGLSAICVWFFLIILTIFERHEGGSRWLTVSNINCLDTLIKVNDSAYRDLLHEDLTVASFVATKVSKLQDIFPNVALQTNGYDCGLYGRDPTTQTCNPSMMRPQLYKS